MSKRKKNGDIFEIHLAPYHDLYVYAKFFDVTTVDKEVNYSQILLVYDFFSITPVNDVNDINFDRLFMNPVYISGGNGLNKTFRCVGSTILEEHEKIIPFLRRPIPYYAYQINTPVDGWSVSAPKGFPLNKELLPFEEVCHLDSLDMIIYINLLPFRIGLEVSKRNKTLPEDVSSYDIVQLVIYRNVIEMPLFSDIPPEKRFKWPIN